MERKILLPNSKSQRVWIVSELYYPELTSTGSVLTSIAEGLADIYDVHVLCGQPSYFARGVRAPAREIHNGVDIRRCSATTLDKDKLIFKVINLITISISLFTAALFSFKRGDIVIAVTNPPLLPYGMALACKLKGPRFLLRIEDVYPEVLTRVGMLREQSLAARLMDRASRWLYNNCDRITVLGRDMERLAVAKIRTRQDRVSLVTNWCRTDTIVPQPLDENILLGKLNLRGRFVVQLSGNLGRTHGIKDVVETAALLKDEPRFQILMIGWGAQKKWAIEQKQSRNLENLTILDPIPLEQFCDSVNGCSVAIISYLSGMSGISVPGKMYSVMAAGKPILAVCDDDSEMAAVVREEDIGWVIPPGRPDLIVSAMRDAEASPERVRAMGERARKAAEMKYTLGYVLNKYQELIEGLRAT
jgi:colanic acid biosynthesis glycosyl transferase WcaI